MSPREASFVAVRKPVDPGPAWRDDGRIRHGSVGQVMRRAGGAPGFSDTAHLRSSGMHVQAPERSESTSEPRADFNGFLRGMITSSPSRPICTAANRLNLVASGFSRSDHRASRMLCQGAAGSPGGDLRKAGGLVVRPRPQSAGSGSLSSIPQTSRMLLNRRLAVWARRR